ncbi:MAG: proline dehydrogenase family protein [Elusimicrobia bacterium]|nr:proline dehydrogenase family protein [Elusimicrobiota bacterium]
MRALTFLARRFVAGETTAESVAAVKKLNKKGLRATLDFLGEDTEDESQASAAADEYVRLLSAIHESGVDANVSLKLTQFGLNLGTAVAKRNLGRVLEEAKRRGNFVRVDMEGSAWTQATLDLVLDAHKSFGNVGTVLQAMLRRTVGDAALLSKAGVKVRLCKGAYKEPSEVAFAQKEEVNANYDAVARDLLDNGPFPAIATHDDARIAAVLAHAKAKKIPADRYEFQMLYGLRARRWTELAGQGLGMRVYVPYGAHWFPYFYRRLRERKENVLFVAKSFFKG